MTEPLVYVVIPAFNRYQDTLECLDSLQRLEYSPYRVVVVDNGSTDGSAEKLLSRFPHLELITNPTNLGFAKACNRGISCALEQGAQYVLLLNNDTIVDKGLLRELVRVAERELGLGLVGPKILYHAQPERIWFAGAKRHHLACHAYQTGVGEWDDGRFDETKKVDFLCGCALLAKRDVWQRVGLLDERYFIYYEDSDFCQRARAAGFQLAFVPQAKVWHKASVEVGWELSPFKVYHRAKSSALFYKQHVKGPHLAFILLLRGAFGFYLGMVRWRQGGLSLTLHHLRGLYDGLRAGKD